MAFLYILLRIYQETCEVIQCFFLQSLVFQESNILPDVSKRGLNSEFFFHHTILVTFGKIPFSVMGIVVMFWQEHFILMIELSNNMLFFRTKDFFKNVTKHFEFSDLCTFIFMFIVLFLVIIKKQLTENKHFLLLIHYDFFAN